MYNTEINSNRGNNVRLSERNLLFEPLETEGTSQREREKLWNVTGRILWLSYLWRVVGEKRNTGN